MIIYPLRLDSLLPVAFRLCELIVLSAAVPALLSFSKGDSTCSDPTDEA